MILGLTVHSRIKTRNYKNRIHVPVAMGASLCTTSVRFPDWCNLTIACPAIVSVHVLCLACCHPGRSVGLILNVQHPKFQGIM